jgi:hypothetical protein
MNTTAAKALLDRYLKLDTSVNFFEDDVLSGAFRGEAASRRVVAMSTMVLTLLKQTAAVITSGGTKTHVAAYESTYRAIAAHLTSGRGRRLTDDDPEDFFSSYDSLTFIVRTAASNANVAVDEALIVVAANTSAAVMDVTASLLASDERRVTGVTSNGTEWLGSLMQVSAVDDSLAERNQHLSAGVMSGTIAVSSIASVLQQTNPDAVLVLTKSTQVDASGFLSLSCGDATATNYVPGGTHESACRYATAAQTSLLDDLASDIGMDILVGFLAVLVFGLVGVIVCMRCKASKRQMQYQMEEMRAEKPSFQRKSLPAQFKSEDSPKLGLVAPPKHAKHYAMMEKPETEMVAHI